MKFEAVPIEQAVGHVLGHNIADQNGRRALRKGKRITSKQVSLLRSLGHETVYVARIEDSDVGEDIAADRISRSIAGLGIRLSQARTGRVNLFAELLGVVDVDTGRLLRLNQLPGVTLATLPQHAVVARDRIMATLKVIPYALAEETVLEAETLAEAPLVCLKPLLPKRVGLILSGGPAVEARVTSSFESALAARVEQLNAKIELSEYVPLENQADEIRLAATIEKMVETGIDLLILAGETAIMDRYDISPRAVERAGGEIACFGAPVDPGNLLMLAYSGAVPILGAPGCSRSPKTNIIDVVLPRLLAGERLNQKDIAWLAVGGLLEDVPERTLPRSRLAA
jgi:molybdenum cofactor cytidylyltransferase